MREIIIEVLELLATLGAVVVTRWLLELSSPKEDWITLKHFFYETFQPEKSHYYRFPEVAHQVRAWIILNTESEESPNGTINEGRTTNTIESNNGSRTEGSTEG